MRHVWAYTLGAVVSLLAGCSGDRVVVSRGEAGGLATGSDAWVEDAAAPVFDGAPDAEEIFAETAGAALGDAADVRRGAEALALPSDVVPIETLPAGETSDGGVADDTRAATDGRHGTTPADADASASDVQPADPATLPHDVCGAPPFVANAYGYPCDFPIVLDQGGLGEALPIRGFGGDASRDRRGHRETLARTPVIIVPGNGSDAEGVGGSASLGSWETVVGPVGEAGLPAGGGSAGGQGCPRSRGRRGPRSAAPQAPRLPGAVPDDA